MTAVHEVFSVLGFQFSEGLGGGTGREGERNGMWRNDRKRRAGCGLGGMVRRYIGKLWREKVEEGIQRLEERSEGMEVVFGLKEAVSVGRRGRDEVCGGRRCREGDTR